jgi:2-polyprenyl-3-methyl-5-hydroxy-6-metoxy-1,4-benzoquinol methylase
VRYFESHEAIYAQRLATGAEGWDDGAYDDFALRDLISSWLATSIEINPGAKVLELGCGTGALSCMLAQLGFQVTGLDISSSAISFAQSMAFKRALSIDFKVADLCLLRNPTESFDAIIDSHVLHCIALPSERKRLLSYVSDSLTPNGEFWTETMVLGEKFQESPTRRMDDVGTVWVAVDGPSRCIDAVRHGDRWWEPMRFIASSAEALLNEFSEARLEPIEWNVAPPFESGLMADFRARLKRRIGDG